MTMERVYGPSQITRYNMFTSALLTGEGEKGVSSGEVIAVVEDICEEVLPRGYDVEWSGVTREEKDSGGQTLLILVSVCYLFIFCWLRNMKVCYCRFRLSYLFRLVFSDHICFCKYPDWK